MLALLTITGSLAGCESSPLTGPPELHLGHQECGDCGMQINEDRCCCAVLIEVDDKQRRYILFDDIGCMLEHKATNPELKVIEHWVRDYTARVWIRGESATYLMTEQVHTPMGSWLIAFATLDAANAMQRDKGGRVLSWDEVIVARRLWMEERYGKRSE